MYFLSDFSPRNRYYYLSYIFVLDFSFHLRKCRGFDAYFANKPFSIRTTYIPDLSTRELASTHHWRLPYICKFRRNRCKSSAQSFSVQFRCNCTTNEHFSLRGVRENIFWSAMKITGEGARSIRATVVKALSPSLWLSRRDKGEETERAACRSLP